ncbi:MAG TPA: trans-aconitate 2-methyltransferase [Devosia sp.]|nr:trans-aconitate 2-methyltransferase [Devosia sp.]
MNDWSPATYLKFEDERTRPARDLLAQVPLERVGRAIDMGCGPGNSTELIAARFPEADIIGLDSSPAMLAEARQRLPKLRFETADAASWVPEGDVDLVFANAIYQWVPGHLEQLPKVLAALRPGAVLAVQMPDNLGEPSHQMMRETAAEGPWAARLRDAARSPLPPVRRYYDALKPFASRLDIWHIDYNHALADAAAIVDWVKGTGLRPFVDPLSPEEREAFLGAYLERIAAGYPPLSDGKVLLRFPRLFIVAQR